MSEFDRPPSHLGAWPELRALFDRIADGAEPLKWVEDPDTVYCGNVSAKTQSGWVITVFIDCGEWDYVDSIVAPDGREWEYPDVYVTGLKDFTEFPAGWFDPQDAISHAWDSQNPTRRL